MKMSEEVRVAIREAVSKASGFESFVFVGIEDNRHQIHIIGRKVTLREISKLARRLGDAEYFENDPDTL